MAGTLLAMVVFVNPPGIVAVTVYVTSLVNAWVNDLQFVGGLGDLSNNRWDISASSLPNMSPWMFFNVWTYLHENGLKQSLCFTINRIFSHDNFLHFFGVVHLKFLLEYGNGWSTVSPLHLFIPKKWSPIILIIGWSKCDDQKLEFIGLESLSDKSRPSITNL